MEPDDNTLSWQAPEYTHREKSADWFWALGIIALAVIAVSIFLGNILFAILILIGSLTIGLFAAREPQMVTIALVQKGVLVGSRLYPFSEIKSFYVSMENTPPVLFLELGSVLVHQLTFPIDTEVVNPDDVRLALAQRVREKEQDIESFSEHVSEFFHF